MPNRDQRRRDGTFEYAQLDLAPTSDEPARCEHGLMAAHFLPVDQKPVRGGCPGPAASVGPPMTRPDATLDQLRTLIDLANAQHLHDAEQWLRERVEAAEERLARPARCEHASTEAHEAIRCTRCGGNDWDLTRFPDCFGAECVTCKDGAMDIGWAVVRYTTCPGPKDGAR